MSSIIITPWRVKSTDSEGKTFRVRQLSFKEGGKYRSLHDDKPFTIEGQLTIRYMARRWFKLVTVTLDLPDALLNAAASFLVEYQSRIHELDCYDFANIVSGIPLHNKSGLFLYWRECHTSSHRLPGDVVFLVQRKRNHFRHAAIYLGYGLYLSVYGKSGTLEVATLGDMRRDFGAKDVLVVVPRIR